MRTEEEMDRAKRIVQRSRDAAMAAHSLPGYQYSQLVVLVLEWASGLDGNGFDVMLDESERDHRANDSAPRN